MEVIVCPGKERMLSSVGSVQLVGGEGYTWGRGGECFVLVPSALVDIASQKYLFSVKLDVFPKFEIFLPKNTVVEF